MGKTADKNNDKVHGEKGDKEVDTECNPSEASKYEKRQQQKRGKKESTTNPWRKKGCKEGTRDEESASNNELLDERASTGER